MGPKKKPSVEALAQAVVGAKVRQFYPGYGEGEENEFDVNCYGVPCCGTFPGKVEECWTTGPPIKGELGKRTLLRIQYDDGDVDDVFLKQVTAVTRREKAKGSRGGKELGPVLVEDHLQDKKVVKMVKQSAKEQGIKLDESQPDLVRQYVRILHVREEILMEVPDADNLLGTSELCAIISEPRGVAPRPDAPRAPQRAKAKAADAPTREPAREPVKRDRAPAADPPAKRARVEAQEKSAAKKPPPDEDDELIMLDPGNQQFEVHLTCPVSRTRITHPVKGQFCTHMDCFDRETFLAFNKRITNTKMKMLQQSVAQVLEVNEGLVQGTDLDVTTRFLGKSMQDTIGIKFKVRGIKSRADAEKHVAALEKGKKEFMERLTAGDSTPFPFVVKPKKDKEQQGAPRLCSAKLVSCDDKSCIIDLHLPVYPVRCPVDACNQTSPGQDDGCCGLGRPVCTLRDVPGMARLLESEAVKSDKDLKTVVVNERYEIIDLKGLKKARERSREATAKSAALEERYDITDPGITVPPLPPPVVKTEPGVDDAPKPAAAKLPAATRAAPLKRVSCLDSFLPSSSAAASPRGAPAPSPRAQAPPPQPSSGGSAHTPSHRQASEQEEAARRSFAADNREIGYVKSFNPDKGFGFIVTDLSNLTSSASKDLYFNGKKFSHEITALLTPKQRVSYRIKACGRGREGQVEGVDLIVLDEQWKKIRLGRQAPRAAEREPEWDWRDAAAAMEADAHQDTCNEPPGTSSAAREDAGGEGGIAPPPAPEVPSPVFLLQQGGSFVGRVSLALMSTAADALENLQLLQRTVDGSSIDITHALPEALIPKDTRLSRLAWAQVVCCEGSLPQGLEALSSELATGQQCAVACKVAPGQTRPKGYASGHFFEQDCLLFLSEQGELWKAVAGHLAAKGVLDRPGGLVVAVLPGAGAAARR